MTIIELREQTATKKNEAGDFEITLNPPLVMDENDSLSISSVFVDSVSTNSGRINITEEESTQFSISASLYLNNWNNTQKKYYHREQGATGSGDFNPPSVVGSNDGFDYILCKHSDTTNGDNPERGAIVRSLQIFGEDDGQTSNWAFGEAITINYIKIDGTKGYYFLDTKDPLNMNTNNTWSSIQAKATFPKGQDNNGIPFACKIDSNNRPILTIGNSNKDLRHWNIKREIQVLDFELDDFNGVHLIPFTFNYNFTIPPDSYTPDELGKLITDKMSKANLTTTDNINYTDEKEDLFDNKYFINSPVKSPFLKTIGECNSANKFENNARTCFLCRSDGEKLLICENVDNWVGSSEIGLVYNDGLSKFQFLQTFSPYYIRDPNDGSIKDMGIEYLNVKNYAQPTPVATNTFFIANKNSGMIITDIEPKSVWYDKMGFDDKLIASIGNRPTKATYREVYSSVETFTDLQALQFDIRDGVDMTGNFDGLDVAVDKANFETKGTFTALQDPSTIFMPITAKYPLNQNGQNSAYYLIELDCKIQNDIIGSNKSSISNNKVSAIVGRYYQTQSYTSAQDGSGSIPYIHRGESIILDHISVKIKDPNFELADSIQDDNIVFVEFQKGEKVQS